MKSIAGTRRRRRHSLGVLSAIGLLLSSFTLAAQPAKLSSYANASRALERVRHHPLELRAFLERLPKGADLHSHLFGAVYAESLIRAAAEDRLCVEQTTFVLAVPLDAHCQSGSVPAASAFGNQALYTSMVDAFSMRSFVPFAGRSAHDHFFSTFDRFQTIDPKRHMGEWLDELASRAARQNEQYLEIMYTPDFALAARLGYKIGWSGDLAKTRAELLEAGLGKNVKDDQAEIEAGGAARQAVEHCDSANPLPACGVKVRFLFQALRGFPPEQVFAQALLGFELASVEPLVVGIDLVMPEDWYLPMHEYHRQMEMFDYLHSVYPKVHISLHAGELAPGLTPPDGLRFHIREAVELGHAERIGHGVDIMYERDPYQLLREMASRHIAVEINLTSNDLILGVRGKDHPLPVYRAWHVPVALSTDDEGVSRIDLTHEFQRAVEEFGLTYSDLKQIAQASIEYSFLPADEKAQQEALLARKYRTFEASVH